MLINQQLIVAGKELFMTDHSLDDSDVKFLEEGNDAVLSLFVGLVFHAESFVVSVMSETQHQSVFRDGQLSHTVTHTWLDFSCVFCL